MKNQKTKSKSKTNSKTNSKTKTKPEKDAGYIYVTRQEYIQPGIYKIGKTVNLKSTFKCYQRQGNIKHAHIYIPDHLSYAETLILNIFGPYRTVREDSIKLSEQVHLPFSLIILIIEWIINHINTHGILYKIKLSRSINTINTHRNQIHPQIWHDLCNYVDQKFYSYMHVPMDTGKLEHAFLLTCKNFDEFIQKYKNQNNIFNENLT